VATISRLLKIYVSCAKEPYKRDYILQKRPIILRSLLIVATPYVMYSLKIYIYGVIGADEKRDTQINDIYLWNGRLMTYICGMED